MTDVFAVVDCGFERVPANNADQLQGRTGRSSLDMPIEDLNFPVWVYNPLKRNDINTLGELTQWSQDNLLSILNPRNARQCLDEIVDTLTAHGYSLAS